MTDFEIDIKNKIEELICEGKLSNEFLIDTCKLFFDYLNPVKVSYFAKKIGKSRQHIYKSKDVTVLLGNKYIIDNL